MLQAAPKSEVIINLSIDGVGEDHNEIRGVRNNWTRALSTWAQLKQLKRQYSNLTLGVHTVISTFNVDRFPELCEYVQRELQPDSYITEIAEERVERLLKSCDTSTDKGVRARALIELLLASGCRVSEAVGLDRAQCELDREARTPGDGIRILDEITVFGKGSKYRRVYLDDRSREWLQKYLATRRDDDKALFVTSRKSADGSYRMTVWTAEQIVREAAKRAGLAEDVSPHWLRHAAVTFWAKHDLTSAQRLAGHRQISTTQRYLGSSNAELKAFYKRVTRDA